tara:strand:- start:338 stop:946 length:609 start_codon:yes stop_codon:yes gene_type:complete
MRSLSIIIPSQSDVLLTLEQFAREENIHGYILSVVGNLSIASFQCPERASPELLKGNLEILTLNGFISPDRSHLHLSISDMECKVWGGHLEKGSIVLKHVNALIGIVEEESLHYSNLNSKNNKRVEVYTLQNCPWSKRSIRLLTRLEIPHKVSIVSSDEEFDLINKRTNSSTFPQIFIDGLFLGGYDALIEYKSLGKLEELR